MEAKISYIEGCSLNMRDTCGLSLNSEDANAAWYSDNVMDVIAKIEAASVRDGGLYFDTNLGHFVTRYLADTESLITAIRNAANGSISELGWPFVDLRPQHSRILATINTNGSHLAAYEVEFSRGIDQMKISIMNSCYNAHRTGSTYRAWKLLGPRARLASMQPNSPLAGLDFIDIIFEEMKCPYQQNFHDCGPFSLAFLSLRLHNRKIPYAGPAGFGSSLREYCIALIYAQVSVTMTSIADVLQQAQSEALLRSISSRKNTIIC